MNTNSLTQGKSYWITYSYMRDNSPHYRTLSRPCLQVRADGFGLFGQVHLDGWGEWKEAAIWLSPDSCVEDTTAQMPKKGFWASLFS